MPVSANPQKRSGTIDIAMPPANLYGVISDITKMGECGPRMPACNCLIGRVDSTHHMTLAIVNDRPATPRVAHAHGDDLTRPGSQSRRRSSR